MSEKKKSIQTGRELTSPKEISRVLESTAYCWALAEQNSPQQLVEIFGVVQTLHIALRLLDIRLGSIEYNPQQLDAVLSSGIGNSYWSTLSINSWMFGLQERLSHTTQILLYLQSINKLKGKEITIQHYIDKWRKRMEESFLTTEPDLLNRHSSSLIETIEFWNSHFPQYSVHLPVATIIESLPTISNEKRNDYFVSLGEATYDIPYESARQLFSSQWESLAKTEDLSMDGVVGPIRSSEMKTGVSIEGCIEAIIQMANSLYDISIRDHISITGRMSIPITGLEKLFDQNLLFFPAYYNPGKKVMVYDIESPVSIEMIRLLVHEIFGHVVPDIFNTSRSTNRRETVLHRSLPDVHEEAIAITCEKHIGMMIAGLFGLSGTDELRDFTNLYRGWADYKFNSGQASLAEIKEQLQHVLPLKTVSTICNTIQLKPGMYFYSYCAIPEQIEKRIGSAQSTPWEILDFLNGTVQSGESWKHPLNRRIATLKKREPYEATSDTLQWLHKMSETLPRLSFDAAAQVAINRPGQVLRSKPTEIFKFVLQELIEKGDAPSIPLKNQSERIHAHDSLHLGTGLHSILARLELDLSETIVEASEIAQLYSVNGLPKDPYIQSLEMFDLIVYAHIQHHLNDTEVQELVLRYVSAWIQRIIIDSDNLSRYEILPTYTHKKVADTLRSVSSYMRQISWTTSLQYAYLSAQRKLEDLSDQFDNFAVNYAGMRRTSKTAYTEYLTHLYGKTPKELIKELSEKVKDLNNKSKYRYIDPYARMHGLIEIIKIGKRLGFKFLPDISIKKAEQFSHSEGLAYLFPAAEILLASTPTSMSRESVVQATTNQELSNMTEEELEDLFYSNAVAEIAKLVVTRKIIARKPIKMGGRNHIWKHSITTNEFMMAYGSYMEILTDDLQQNATFLAYPTARQNRIIALLRDRARVLKSNFQASEKIVEQGDDGGRYANFSIDLGVTVPVVELYDDIPGYIHDLYPSIIELPEGHPILTLVQKNFGNTITGRAHDYDPTHAYKKLYKVISNGVWESRIEAVIQDPLAHLAVPILIHEAFHGFWEVVSRMRDPEKYAPSSIHFGPQVESLPTFLAWLMVNDFDPKLAKSYLTYITYSGLGELSLNYGLDAENPRPSTMAKVWELYSEYLTEGQALYLARIHTTHQRVKPWRLSYIADFDNWHTLYNELRNSSMTQEEAINFLLLLGTFCPRSIIRIKEQYPEDWELAIVEFREKTNLPTSTTTATSTST